MQRAFDHHLCTLHNVCRIRCYLSEPWPCRGFLVVSAPSDEHPTPALPWHRHDSRCAAPSRRDGTSPKSPCSRCYTPLRFSAEGLHWRALCSIAHRRYKLRLGPLSKLSALLMLDVMTKRSLRALSKAAACFALFFALPSCRGGIQLTIAGMAGTRFHEIVRRTSSGCCTSD